MSVYSIDQDAFVSRTIMLTCEAFTLRALATADGAQEKDQHTDLEKAIDASMREAEQITKNQKFRDVICATLGTTVDSVKEVAKIVATAILSLHLGGALQVEVTPMIAAGAALIVFDAGISGFCG